MKSIQQRLNLGLVTSLLIAGILLVQIALWLVDNGLRRYFEATLQQEATLLLTTLTRTGEIIEPDINRQPIHYRRPFSGQYFQMDIEGQQWRSRSLWDGILPATASDTGLQAKLHEGPQAQELLIFIGHYEKFRKPITITVARDYTPILQHFNKVKIIAAAFGVLALMIILLIQRWIVRRALSPLEKIRQQIAQLHAGERSTLDTDVPEELLPLASQINNLLHHTEKTLERSRHAIGNLSHALKTPLAVIFSLLHRPEIQANPQLAEKLTTQTNAIQQRVQQELSRARFSGTALPGAQFDCEKELPDLFSTLALIHNNTLTMRWATDAQLRLPWDREDMLELLGNILDNACKWADSTIELDIRKREGVFYIQLDDDGPGIDSESRSQVLQRGTRLDENTDGHGLGLDIVRKLIEGCQGTLSLDESPLGGLRVEIALPVNRHLLSH